MTAGVPPRPRRPGGRGGVVVTVSTAGPRADPFISYSSAAAKAGIVNLVRQAALDLARWQTRVNAIAPGPLRTKNGGGASVDRSAHKAEWGTARPRFRWSPRPDGFAEERK
ncbi:SDR family oxidoreductase [Amycolatopsis pigmentata]|uniref:SDR family oxidoreductase n=1 Tax=Amycolatopsis pigmentata TaxID=450801 RepID=A0ABW5FZ19_9PSEU